MHCYYHNITEWITYTQHLTPYEEGVLFRLIGKQFYDEAPLLRNGETIERLCRKLRLSKDEVSVVESLIDEFFIETKDGYINQVYEGKLREIMRKNSSASARGKMGGRPRKSAKNNDNDEIGIKNKTKKLNVEFLEEESEGTENHENKDIKNNGLQGDNQEEIKNSDKKLNKKLTTYSPSEINDLKTSKSYYNYNHNYNHNNNYKTTQDTPSNTDTLCEKPEPEIFVHKSSSLNFLKFIEDYPKPVDNSKMQKAAGEWRFGKHEMHHALIMKNLHERIGKSKWREWIGTDDQKYIPDPANFLKNNYYREEIEHVLSDDERMDKFLDTLDFGDE